MKLGIAAALLLISTALRAQTEEAMQKFYSGVHAALALKPGAVVADIGSGDDPEHAIRIAAAIGPNGKVVCVDIKQAALDKLKQKLPASVQNIELHLGKPDDPLLPKNAFDAVLISNAYHEMAEHQGMLAHLRESLKSEGRLVVIEAIDNRRRKAAREEQVQNHEFSPDRLETELVAAGFKVVDRVEPLIAGVNDGVVRYLLAATPAESKKSDPWAALRFLEGSWEGPSAGEPGKGVSSRVYRFDLGGHVLSARNQSVWQPKSPSSKSEVHEDIGMFSYDNAQKKIVLRQFHVEGFVNEYVLESMSPDGKLLEFVTVRIENIPPGWKAREAYRVISPDEFVETFSLAPPGKDFSIYSETRLKREK